MSFCSWETDEIYRDVFEPGIYVCSMCHNELFSSLTKFEHHSPWPAFTKPIHSQSVLKELEVNRPGALKLFCGKCKNPLGHEFINDGLENMQGAKSSRF